MAALSGLAQNFVSEALCLLGMSWVGGEQPAAPESSPNCRDPTCRNPHPPEVPRQGNLERKASGQICIQGRTPLEQWREAHALLSHCSQGSQLMPGARDVGGGWGCRHKPLSGAHSLVQSPIVLHVVPPARGPSLPQSLHGTVTGVCTFFPSFSLFSPFPKQSRPRVSSSCVSFWFPHCLPPW